MQEEHEVDAEHEVDLREGEYDQPDPDARTSERRQLIGGEEVLDLPVLVGGDGDRICGRKATRAANDSSVLSSSKHIVR